MDEVPRKARFDWLVEVAGATAAGLATGFATYKLAPSLGLDPVVGLSTSGMTAFALGLLAMRAVRPSQRDHKLAGLSLQPIEIDAKGDVVASEPLLLEVAYEEPEAPTSCAEDGELLLDDPLVVNPDSRVVQLFASQPMPTAGELKRRIDRHLAVGGTHPIQDEEPAPDASAALYAALADLRRSLR